jgi:pyruvate ferredoxin oxidoreductase beta subunit
MSLGIKTLTDTEYIGPGRSGCPGCASMLIARLALKALGEDTILVSATGCVLSNFTHAGSPRVPFIHSLLPGAGSLVSGIDAGLRALGKRSVINLLVIAGDGGTADIGFQALSGAVERGHRFIYLCYDNEGYMNTGGQRSGTTPIRANTATTPAFQDGSGGRFGFRKNMIKVMAAHEIPYVASASLAYPQDFLRKLGKAIDIDGPSYIHILAPCNYRWGFRENLSIRVAKLAVETHIAPLLEIEFGKHVIVNQRDRKKKPVSEYLMLQKRFQHLNDDQIAAIQTDVDDEWSHWLTLSARNITE